MAEEAPKVPFEIEALSPEEAAAVLKRHNPRLAGSEELLAETIRRVRSGVKPLDEDALTLLRRMLAEDG